MLLLVEHLEHLLVLLLACNVERRGRRGREIISNKVRRHVITGKLASVLARQKLGGALTFLDCLTKSGKAHSDKNGFA